MTLSPGTPRKARRPIKRVNRKRKAKNWTRAYGSVERVAFVASMPCIALWTVDHHECGGDIENAHVVKGDGGAGYKASAEYIAPLCTDHHRHLHRVGPDTFQRVHDVDLAACAAETARAWEARGE